jgi:NtrC-family two-component system response regulator AlgB
MLKEAGIRVGRSNLTLSWQAAEALLTYRWPGNVRELPNTIEHAVALAPSESIRPEDLPESVRHPSFGLHIPEPRGTSLKDFEREHILPTLAESATLEEAAATLGINATTLWRKRKRYGIS